MSGYEDQWPLSALRSDSRHEVTPRRANVRGRDRTVKEFDMPKGTCSIDGCDKPVKTRGMCGMHVERVRKWGDPHNPGTFIKGDLIARFWSKVEKRGPEECWPWLGTVLANGYGQFHAGRGKRVPAHRFAYELMAGPIPDGLQIDHVRAWGCTRTDCVNPAHMEPVTLLENARRSDCWSAVNSRKELCQNGHEFDLVKVFPDGRRHRRCRTCKNEWQRERRRQRKLAGLR